MSSQQIEPTGNFSVFVFVCWQLLSKSAHTTDLHDPAKAALGLCSDGFDIFHYNISIHCPVDMGDVMHRMDSADEFRSCHKVL